MIVPVCLMLLAAFQGREMVDEVHRIPAGDWKYVDVALHETPARISVSYEVLSGSGRVRAVLMLRQDLEQMNSDLAGSIIATPEGRRGYFTDPIRRRGDYVVVLDNQDGRVPARVRLHVGLDFSAGPGSDAGRLTPQRQRIVVALSCAAFLGIVGFSARRLRKAMKL